MRQMLTLFNTGLVESTSYRVFMEMFYKRMAKMLTKYPISSILHLIFFDSYILCGLVHALHGRGSAVVQEQRVIPVIVVGL